MESNGSVKNYPLCTRFVEKNASTFQKGFKNYSINSERTNLFVHYYKYLLTVNLTDLDNTKCNGKNTYVDDVYFGQYKTYVYFVNDKILTRWLATPKGTLISPVLVAKTKFVS